MTEGTDALVHDASPDDAATAGTLLRAGREAAGLSVAAVAQQLKLAPRQVVALEESDFANLPGRTFVRGFVRNYARLLHLDAAAVLAALPDSTSPTSLENPSLAPTPRPMGELPADAHAKPSAARWAIPLALVAVVTIAAVYEITRPPAEPARSSATDKSSSLPIQPQPILPQPNGAAAPSPLTSTPLPNPLADDKGGAAPEKSADKAAEATAQAPAASDAGGSTPAPMDARDASIALAFQGTSWVEVRDGAGVLILSVTGTNGDRQAVSGRPPFDVVLGNAAAVTVTWQGKAFDTSPFNRQNVARFTLR